MKDLEKEVKPWENIHVDLAGPWKASFKSIKKGKKKKDTITKNFDVEIQIFTSIDEATSICEIFLVKEKSSNHIAKAFDMYWLCRYPRQKKCIYDNGGEFVGIEFQELLHSYNIEDCPTMVKTHKPIKLWKDYTLLWRIFLG